MTGLFETMLVVNGHVIELDAHYERMHASARALGFPEPDRDAFRAEVMNAATGDAVRCVYTADRWVPEASAIEIPPLTLERRRDARAITLSTSRELPGHKLTSLYTTCIDGLRHAAEQGANEGLFLDRDGNVLEGTVTNVFAVRGDTLITARDGVLPGIVRAWVLEQGLPIEWRAPAIEELRAGAFLTGSLTGLAALRSLDGAPCDDPGEVFAGLSRRRAAHYRFETARAGRGI